MKKIIFLAIVCSLSLSSYAAKKKKRKPSSVTYPYESVIVNYESNVAKFKNLRLHFGPFNKSISFKMPLADHLSDGKGGFKVVKMDCYADLSNTKWNCLGGCGGGDLVLGFNESVRLDKVTVKAYSDFIPRACDGTESARDEKMSHGSDIEFTYKNMSME